MTEICQRCNEEDEDRRTLWMGCFYDMSELEIPFNEIRIPHPTYGHSLPFFTLLVCKNCRSDWMNSIKEWFNNPIKE